MNTKQLTKKDKQILEEFKIPHWNSMIICIAMICLISLLIVGIFFIDVFNEGFLFQKLRIQFTFPVVSIVAVYLRYRINVKAINNDLQNGLKQVGEYIINSKGVGKYGTFSTGNNIASGSSNEFYLEFGGLKYICSKDEFDNNEVGDKITVATSMKAKVVLSIKASSQN